MLYEPFELPLNGQVTYGRRKNGGHCIWHNGHKIKNKLKLGGIWL